MFQHYGVIPSSEHLQASDIASSDWKIFFINRSSKSHHINHAVNVLLLGESFRIRLLDYVLDIFNQISKSEIHNKISILINCCWLGNLCIEIIGAVKYVLKKRTSSSILKKMVC